MGSKESVELEDELDLNADLDLDATNAGASTSFVVSVVPNVEISSGVAVTVGSGKTMVIDVLQIGNV